VGIGIAETNNMLFHENYTPFIITRYLKNTMFSASVKTLTKLSAYCKKTKWVSCAKWKIFFVSKDFGKLFSKNG